MFLPKYPTEAIYVGKEMSLCLSGSMRQTIEQKQRTIMNLSGNGKRTENLLERLSVLLFCVYFMIYNRYNRQIFLKTFSKDIFPLIYAVCIFLAISLATTTPVTEACINPRVIPAPSPMAYRFFTAVSKLFSTDILEE